VRCYEAGSPKDTSKKSAGPDGRGDVRQSGDAVTNGPVSRRSKGRLVGEDSSTRFGGETAHCASEDTAAALAQDLRWGCCECFLLKDVAGLAEGGCYGAEAPVAGRNSRVFIGLGVR